MFPQEKIPDLARDEIITQTNINSRTVGRVIYQRRVDPFAFTKFDRINFYQSDRSVSTRSSKVKKFVILIRYVLLNLGNLSKSRPLQIIDHNSNPNFSTHIIWFRSLIYSFKLKPKLLKDQIGILSWWSIIIRFIYFNYLKPKRWRISQF